MGLYASLRDVLEAERASSFFLASVLLAVFAGVTVAEAITNPDLYSELHGVSRSAGFLFGLLGLLGVYPKLAARRPKSAGVGVAFVVLGAVGFSLEALWHLAQFVGEEWGASVPNVVFLVSEVVGLILGYFVFATVSLRTNAYSRALGLLLLAPAIVFAVDIAAPEIIGSIPSRSAKPVVTGVQALSHLAIGFRLRSESPRRES